MHVFKEIKNGANSPPEGEKGHVSGAGGVRIDIGRKGEKRKYYETTIFIIFMYLHNRFIRIGDSFVCEQRPMHK